MTITVTEDIVEGRSTSRSSSGLAATRVFKAVCSAGEDELDVLLHADIPQFGEQLAGTGGTGQFSAVYVTDATCEPEEGQTTIFRVVVNYSRPTFDEKQPSDDEDAATIQVGSSVSATKTQKDKNGDQLVVELSGQPDQVGDVDIQVPETVITFERKESASPFTKAKNNVGHVNSASLGSGAFAARTLLCLGIDGVSNDDGDSWQVTYRFQYRAETWDALIVYIDPETDRPHNDIDLDVAGAGWISSRIYPEVDFSSLSLPF